VYRLCLCQYDISIIIYFLIRWILQYYLSDILIFKIPELIIIRINFLNSHIYEGPSWPWSCGCWIYNYLYNQCLSSLMLRVRISIRARCTTLCDKVCQWLATGRWFSPGPPVSSTNKTDRHDITEILLNTIKPNQTKPNQTKPISTFLFSLRKSK
jgi:hypothetical protein